LFPVAAAYILIAVVAAVGNLLVCFAILTNRSLRSKPSNLLLLSLAVSDLLTVVLAMPFDKDSFLQGHWRHGPVMCVTSLTSYLITVPTSILTLLAISLDRYQNLLDPLRGTKKELEQCLTSFTVSLKAARTTFMLVAAFFFCWQPFSYFSIVGILYGEQNWDPYPSKVFYVLLMFGYLNSALNPFFFAFRNKQFKATYVRMFNL
ncbi:unnamed protein product, partial [Porites evermanni]